MRRSARRSPSGIDRQRIVDNFSPPGSEVATHFTPCSIAGGCEGGAWPPSTLAAAKQMLADAGFANGFKTKIQYRDVSRAATAENQNVLAQDLQAQLRRTSASPRRSRSRSPEPSSTTPTVASSTGSTSSVGARTIRMPRTSSTTTSVAARAPSSVTSSMTSPDRSSRARPGLTRRPAPSYARPTTPSGRTSRWSRSRMAAPATAYRADVEGRAQLAARQRGVLRSMTPADRTRSSGCRTPSRPASTAPTSRTARPSASASR